MKILKSIAASIILAALMVGSASAYQIKLSAVRDSTMTVDSSKKAVFRQDLTPLGVRVEAHALPTLVVGNATNLTANSFGIYPDVVDAGMGSKINVDFIVDIKNNNPSNRGCVVLIDPTTTPNWKVVGSWCNVGVNHHNIEIQVGKSYRLEVNSGSKYNTTTTSSGVVSVTWAIAQQEAYYTSAAAPVAVAQCNK